MKANIEGEDDDYVKIYVTDNRDVTHNITVEKQTGEIAYHEQDGYPDDPANRTTAGDEHINQARRYARFYVYRKRGYDTVEPMRNPDRIAAVTLAIGSLTQEQLLEYFGEYYQQLASYHTNQDPRIEAPVDASVGVVRPEIDVYLTDLSSASNWEAFAETLADVNAFERLETEPGSDAANEAFISRLETALAEDRLDLRGEAGTIGEFLLDDVSPLRVWWQRGTTTDTIETAGAVPERDPDVRVQMLANMYEFGDPNGFQQWLVHHLRCQIRDCYIRMGIAPPEDLRVQGPGIYEQIGWYENHDFYPNYHDHRVEITDWQREQTTADLVI